MGAACSKKQSQSFPAEFSQQVAHLQKIREGTLEIVKQLDKFNTDKEASGGKKKKQKKPPPPKVLDQVVATCVKFSASLAGHTYAEQMGRLASACKKMSKHMADTQEQIDRKAVTPMRQWAGEGYENLMKELVKCQKLKENVKRMEKQVAAKPELKEKLETVKKAYESQRRFCSKEVEALERVFSNHMQYITEFTDFQWKESIYACIQLEGALMNTTLKTAQSGRQQPEAMPEKRQHQPEVRQASPKTSPLRSGRQQQETTPEAVKALASADTQPTSGRQQPEATPEAVAALNSDTQPTQEGAYENVDDNKLGTMTALNTDSQPTQEGAYENVDDDQKPGTATALGSSDGEYENLENLHLQ